MAAAEREESSRWKQRAAAGAGLVALAAAALVYALPAPHVQKAKPSAVRTLNDVTGREPIQPIEALAPLDASGRAQAMLGYRLFSDPILSADHSVACATCHDLATGGDDGKVLSRGVTGHVPARNTPTVFNVDLNSMQSWEGRVESLEAQLDEPILSPNVLGTTYGAIVERLYANLDYRVAFASVFPGQGITPSTIRSAIAAYERRLVTTDSRFDRFLRGNPAAVTDEEKTGYEKFKTFGCVTCHQGRNVGGNLFERIGVMRDYFAERGGPVTPADLGRYNFTKLESDRHRFRVPSLRMAALTAPYFHDGRAATLEDAIRMMAHFQIGEELEPPDVQSIAAFIRSLAGTYDGRELHADR